MRLVLASASTGRLAVLRAAGIDPVVIVSGVDETVADGVATRAAVGLLAQRKAEAVAGLDGLPQPCAVIGCDSLLEIDGAPHGKPGDPATAVARWRRLRGRSGSLLTGHHLVDVGSGRIAAEVTSTVVHFGCPSDAEIEAYVATGEPLAAAGAFTLDGRSAPWIERIEGDPSTVIGLSMPALGRLFRHLGRSIVDVWSPPSTA